MGKLKDSHIKKELARYYNGDPDCADCPKGCPKGQPIKCYTSMKQAHIGDDNTIYSTGEMYTRDNTYHCCGRELVKLDNNNLYCEVCGAEYGD